MREIRIRIERNVKRAEFDVQFWEDGEWHILGTMTAERIHNWVRSETNKAIESLE